MAAFSCQWRPGFSCSTVSISALFQIAFQLFMCCSLISGAVSSQFTDFYFTVEPSDIIGYKGRPLTIDCVAYYEGGDSPTIQWIKNGNFLSFEGNTRIQVLSNGSLLIADLEATKSMSDEGQYQCTATVDGDVTILSRKANIQIAYVARNFLVEPHNVEVFLTDTAMFQCEIDGVPKPNITWLKDNKPVKDETGKFRTYPNGVLQIYEVKFRDFGNYVCQAEGIDKVRRSEVAKLNQKNVEDGFQGMSPEFTLKPKDTKAIVMSKVVLFCGAYGLDSNMDSPTILWLKDGVTIDFTKTQGRLTIIGDGNLQILNVGVTDDGIYMCRAENDVDSIDAEAKLTVLVPPTFVREPQDTYAHTKHDILKECKVIGKPKPTVTFYKNSDPIIPNDYFEIVDGTDLRILGLVQSDSGYYQCFAENEVGNIQSGAQLVVLDQDVPIPLAQSTPSIYYHLHRAGTFGTTNRNSLPSAPMRLSAAITSTRFVKLTWGVPTKTGPIDPSEIIAYSIQWKERGSERERVMNLTQVEATIQRLKPNTEYTFEVRAYNRFGPGTEAATLTLTTDQEVFPSEPRNLRTHPLSPTSIEVMWEPPTNPGNLQHYSLIYYPVGSQEEKQVTVRNNELDHVLTNLISFQEYSFRVVAFNNNGPGMSTEEVVARTFSDRPSDVPRNFTLEAASSTSVIVRWQPPAPEARNGHITGYKIRYKKTGAKKGLTVTTDGNRNLYALTGLRKDTEYQVRISAQTVNGSGPVTGWEYGKTYEDDLDESIVPDIPDRLMVKPLSNSLVVQWVPNRRTNVLVRGYYLGYGKGVPDVYRQVFDADTFSYTIENLQPASEYVVTIRAFNNRGEGQQRYETVFTAEETRKLDESVAPMLPPIGLKAIVFSANTIVVTWTDDSLGKVQLITDNRFYTVRYNTVPSNRGRFKFVNSTDLYCHIDDLKPATQYEFSVKVIKGRRHSTWSMAVTNTTLEDAPGSVPRDLTLVRNENDPLAVTLNWQPPQKPNGQITGYLVLYTTDPTQNDNEWVVDGVVGESLSRAIKDLTEDTDYYFKVQARNSMGYGPMSATKMYRTPKLRAGSRKPYYPGGSGSLDNPLYDDSTKDKSRDKEKQGELSQNFIIIIIACVVGVTFCIVVAVVTVILCRKRDAAERTKRAANMYQKGGSPTKGKPQKPGGPREGQPPDLWIDHNPIELKHLANDERAESVLSIASTRRNSHDSKCDTLPRVADVYNSGSEAEERLLPPQYHQLPQAQQRNIIRPKPLMLPVDSQQQQHPREPITVAAYPNGHLMQRYPQVPMPVSPSEESSGVVPMRPVYPRTQYQMQYGAQGPPRVNAGDISQSASMHGYPMEIGYRLVPCIEEEEGRYPESYDDSMTSRVGYGYIPEHSRAHLEKTPMGIASPVVAASTTNPESYNSLGRQGNPLKSFSVPEPPNQIPRAQPGTPQTPKHIVKPQQTASPYKKPAAPISSGPIKPRSPMPPAVPAKAPPDVTLKPGKEENPDIQKSLSTEELTAEMANLEGLMKDLNAITQQDFEV